MRRRSADRPAAGSVAALAAAALLAACGLFRSGSPDNEPTLRTLAGRTVTVDADAGLPKASEDQAIAAYRKFLEIAPAATQRAEAMRRIGDLEMDRAENRAASASAGADAPDFKAAIAQYQQFLRAYPNDPGNDRVLYQLARAHEQGGDLETALKTLDRLVKDHPATRFNEEAQFRRGELLFTARRYGDSEKAFGVVLAGGKANPFHDRALYMHGWSLYKQSRLDEALASFFGVLDQKVGRLATDGATSQADASLETLQGLSRADRELVEDTFRVTSISLENLKGAETIPAFIDSSVRKSYEFRVYEQLAELYIRQERVKDAADTFGLFARRNPLHAQAPVLQARVIGIYEKTGFAAQALGAKKEYVARYGRQSDFRIANADGWKKAQPLVKAHLSELARHYHATAQKGRAKDDIDEAIRWYRELIVSHTADADAPRSNFLLAELLFDDKRYGDASTEYEKTAYGYAGHEKSADAGYAALLAHAELVTAGAPAAKPALQRASVASAVRFGDAFGADPRAGSVLADAAEKLYALGDGARAATLAKRVVELQPKAADADRKLAWTVLAHTSFESASFAASEQAYAEVLKLTGERDAARADLVERQAAAVYKQGEQAREAGRTRDAVASFARVAAVAPQSPIRATAQYDAAASLLALKDWDSAASTLEDFRKRYPNHPLQSEVSGKLAVAYLEKQQWPQAAAEYERIAAAGKDPALARSAQWQAAELYEKGQARQPAAKAYETYLRLHPQPLEPAVEARFRLARLAKEDGQLAREAALMKEILQADQAGGAARTARTRYLGATAALAVAEPVAEQYRRVALVEPLQQQLRLKKARMEDALKAYAVAAEYGVADVSTAATYRIAIVYRDFGKALMASERPKKLSKVEREQYDVLLEEQAFPFEEKAIELHEVNARRATQGVWDPWVRSSFAALRELKPVRYGKTEVAEGAVDAIR